MPVGKDWREELEVPDGNRIEDQVVMLLVIAHTVEMLQRFNGRWLCARGAHGIISAASGVFA
jgi:hypothetical protein